MWLLVTLDRLLSYAVTTLFELAKADSMLIALGECPFYRDGSLSRFDCTNYKNSTN